MLGMVNHLRYKEKIQTFMHHSNSQLNLFLQKNGFSLIELLLVIAILGILVAIATSEVHQANIRGKGRATSASLQAIEAAKDAWRMEFGETAIPNPEALTRYTGGIFPNDPWGLGFVGVTDMTAKTSSPANNNPSKEPKNNNSSNNGFNDLGEE